MNFGILCDFFDNVRHTKGTSEKTKLTKTFISALRDQQQDLFPVLRLIIPKLDRDRPSYRIKESKISKLLIKMLGLPHGNDQNVLLKAITGTSSGVDFGDVVYSVLKKYVINKDAGLTIQNINTYLDQIAHRKTDNGLDDLVLNIFRKLSPRNIKWLIQIILKDLKLGISDNHVLNCYHDDGADFYATNSNLKRMCEVLRNPQVKMHELEINIFEPFRPMLSKRCDASNFKKCFPDSKFIVENKFDGERFQLHMEDGKFKYFFAKRFRFHRFLRRHIRRGHFHAAA
jgi:DNA ligase-4